MIDRDLAPRLRKLARQFPAVTLTGPRQSGKSTLCRAVFPKHAYANLEAPDVRSFASEDPRGFLAQFSRGAILDEIQRAPELASYIQSLIDEDPRPGRWVPLARSEILRFRRHPQSVDEAILAGGYPRIFDRKLDAYEWLGSYIATYIERDVRLITNVGNLATFQRFVELCAGRTSQLLNLSQVSNDCGIAQPTAKAWFSVLEASFVAFRLPAFSRNIRKRLVKMPKLHFYDTGLACRLLGIRTVDQLRSHPLRGPLFETWVVSEILKHRMNAGESGGMYHYRDQNGVEADLVVEQPGRLSLVEAKAAGTAGPGLCDGLDRVRTVLEQAQPCGAFVIYGGDTAQKRSNVEVLPWRDLHERRWG
jgi:predicted AAA+ superfamily ATPase